MGEEVADVRFGQGFEDSLGHQRAAGAHEEAQLVAQDAARQAMSHGMKEVEIRVKGPGSGREAAIRSLQVAGLEISAIKDVTPIPHNGCRPPKRRRV